jgi:hypothetical protein
MATAAEFLGGGIWSNAIKRLCFDDNTTRNVVDDNTTREYKNRRNSSLPCHVVRISCNCKSSFSSSPGVAAAAGAAVYVGTMAVSPLVANSNNSTTDKDGTT